MPTVVPASEACGAAPPVPATTTTTDGASAPTPSPGGDSDHPRADAPADLAAARPASAGRRTASGPARG